MVTQYNRTRKTKLIRAKKRKIVVPQDFEETKSEKLDEENGEEEQTEEESEVDKVIPRKKKRKKKLRRLIIQQTSKIYQVSLMLTQNSTT